jgi:hypothetical protein
MKPFLDCEDDLRVTASRDHTVSVPVEPPQPEECNSVCNEVGAVEKALADGIAKAVAAGQWGVVSQLGRELEARRVARAGNVVPLRRRRVP